MTEQNSAIGCDQMCFALFQKHPPNRHQACPLQDDLLAPPLPRVTGLIRHGAPQHPPPKKKKLCHQPQMMVCLPEGDDATWGLMAQIVPGLRGGD